MIAIHYYTNSDSYINKKPLSDSDIVGTWEFGDSGPLHFDDNGSIVSETGYFHGSWKILSSDDKYVQISFDMSEEEYEKALEELYIAYLSEEELEESGLEPYEYMKEDVWEMYTLPEDALMLRFIRTENRMIAIDEYDDWEMHKKK
ncbi:MAG: hypothetical protein IJJ06_06755 [Mogibacterium sp.]|nr:hypothetical protein [Mogibacterium sp.]